MITTATWGLFLLIIMSADRIEKMSPGFMRYFVIYILVVNIIGFAVMLSDKERARRKQRRVPENILFRITAAGGGIGTTTGMFLARHKTQHTQFLIWLPAITMINFSLLITEVSYLLLN